MGQAFTSISAWTDHYAQCMVKWTKDICVPFFVKHAPSTLQACNDTLANANSKLAGLFDFPQSSYGYSVYDNRAVGLRISHDVSTAFNWIVPTICQTKTNETFNECILDGYNLTQELSCNHAIYANHAAEEANSNGFNYVVPILATAFLCYMGSGSEPNVKTNERRHTPTRNALTAG